MLTYWLMFSLPAIGALSTRPGLSILQQIIWLPVLLLFILTIGLRHQVGGDWESYLELYAYYSTAEVKDILSGSDPGYYLLNRLAAANGWFIYGVNMICGAFAVIGISMFARQQAFPWLALAIAVTYFLIVVAMGYTRQAAAIGLLMMGLAFLGRDRVVLFIFFIALAVTFHKSAILMLPLVSLAVSRNSKVTGISVGLLTMLLFFLLLMETYETMLKNYVVDDRDESGGGLVRVAMNSIAAMVYLCCHRRLGLQEVTRRLWWWGAVVTLALLPITPYSATAVDRVVLYLLPLQFVVFGNLPMLVKGSAQRLVVIGGVLGFYGLVLFVWLFFATNAHAWLPYQNLLLLF